MMGPDWIAGVLGSLCYLGIFLLLVLARAVPPVPAETVIPLAGLAAAQGELSLPLVALAGGLDSAVGELAWFLPSRLLGRDRLLGFFRRHGHWLTLRPEEVERAGAWFARHGALAVVLCQPIPGAVFGAVLLVYLVRLARQLRRGAHERGSIG